MRINKYLSSHGVCSRRDADKLVEERRVKIDGKIAKLGDTVEEESNVQVDNDFVIDEIHKLYIAYNKPKGIEVTQNKTVKKSLANILPFKSHIFPIGRLDKDSSGLLLLTNDGDIVNKILKPKGQHEKEYLVHVDKEITTKFMKQLRQGIKIKHKKTLPTRVQYQNKNAFKIILTEGRNRQIRKMTEALGYKVISLKRLRIMNIKLGHLEPNKFRELSKKELTILLKQLG